MKGQLMEYQRYMNMITRFIVNEFPNLYKKVSDKCGKKNKQSENLREAII